MLIKKIIEYLPGSLIPALIGLFSTTIFTRYLTTEDFGKYSLIFSLLILLVALMTQWLLQSISRYLPGEKSLEKVTHIKDTISTSILFVILTFLFFSIALYFLFIKSSIWEEYFFSSLLFVIGLIFFNTCTTILQAQFQAKQYSLLNMFNAILKLALSFIFLIFFNLKGVSLILGTALSYLVTVPIMLKITSLKVIVFKRNMIRSSIKDVKKFLKYGFPMIGWFLSASLMNIGDRYIIQFFYGPEEVGIYSANYNIIQGSIGLISAPLILAAHPFLMNSWNNKDEKLASEWLGKIITWIIITGTILTCMLSFYGLDIANILLGKSFREGYFLMPILFAGFICWQIGTYAHKPFEFYSKTKTMLFISVISAILNLFLNFLFVPFYGYAAAAYTTLASYLFYTICVSIIGKKHLHWKLNIKYIVYFIIISLLLNFMMNNLRDYSFEMLQINYTGFLLFSVIVYIILYAISFYILKYLLRKSHHFRG